MKHKYKSNVPRDKNGRFLLKNNYDMSILLMVVGFAMLMLPIPAFVLTISYSIVWLSYILAITMWIGLMMIAIGTIT